MNKTYELALTLPPHKEGAVDIIRTLLVSLRIPLEQLVEMKHHTHTSLCIYTRHRKELTRLKKYIQQLNLTQITLKNTTLHDKEWQTKWKKDLKPLALTQQFDVVPLWQKKTFQPPKHRHAIFIDATLAFGSGLHATTQFMAQFIERYQGKFTRFLDIGTGTGLLSIIAEKCGAQEVCAVEIDKDAAQTAKKNIQHNQCRKITIVNKDFHSFSDNQPYDFIAANLFTQDLIAMAENIIQHLAPSKYLAVSGISLANANTLRQAFRKLPLRCLKIEKAQGWVAILYKKTNVNRTRGIL